MVPPTRPAKPLMRLREDTTTLRFGPPAVLHALLDVVVDDYGDAAEKVRDSLGGLERSVFSAAREDIAGEISLRQPLYHRT